jgi:PAS domain S-box-containing protein
MSNRPSDPTPQPGQGIAGLASGDLLFILPDPVFVLDGESCILWLNDAAETLSGFPMEQVVGKPCTELLAADDQARVLGYLKRQHEKAQPQVDLDATLVTRGGASTWASFTVRRVVAVDGAPRYVCCVRNQNALHLEMERVQGEVQELTQKIEELQSNTKLKDEYLATMSHEIRTPMNGVIGMSHLLLESNLDRDQRTFAEVIRNSAMALLTLINDILDFSKIEAGKLDIEKLDFDLRVAIEGVTSLLAPRADEKGVTLVSSVHHEVPSRLRGDPGRIRQVMLNLMGNAIKFTDQGEVGLSIERLEESTTGVRLRFSVRDTGIGIPADQLDGLFNAFAQADATISRRFGGTGLGLAISRRLVQLMGGQVGVSSEPGSGSTFWFELPFEKQPETESPPVHQVELAGLRVLVADPVKSQCDALAEMLKVRGCVHTEVDTAERALDELRIASEAGQPYQVVIIDMQIPAMGGEALGRAIRADRSLDRTLLMLLTNLGRRGDAARAQEAGFAAYLLKPVQQAHLHDALIEMLITSRGTSTPGPKELVTRHTVNERRRGRVRVLLVEDNPVNQLVAVSALRRFGYGIDVASNGAKALEMVAEQPYDIVFMDIQMPVMDGYECATRMRAQEGAERHTPIVAMTANTDSSDRERCFAAGMDDFISKPVDLEALCAMVENRVSPERKGQTQEAEAEERGAPEDRGRVVLIGAKNLMVPDGTPAPAIVTSEGPAKAAEASASAATSSIDTAPSPVARPRPIVDITEAARSSVSEPPPAPAAEFRPPDVSPAAKSRRPAPIPIATLISGAPGAGLDDTIPVLDEGRLEASCMGRDDLRALLVRTFLSTAQQRIARIGECLSGNDSKGVEFEAHGMKGMCLTLGAARCGRLFAEIERLGREGSLEGVPPLLNRVRVEATKAENELSRFDAAA